MKRIRQKSLKLELRLPLVAVLVVAGALIVLISFRQKPVRSEAAGAKDVSPEYTLKLNNKVSPAAAGMIWAIADGSFQRNGLHVSLVAGLGDNDALSAVAADESTIGIVSAAGFLKARSDGLPIVAFAAYYAVSAVEFFALPDTKLLEPANLEGKRIGYNPSPDISNILSEFASKNSLAQSKLRLVESDAPLEDLLDRKADVILGRRDIEGQELERRNVEYTELSPDSYGVHAPGPLFIANERAFDRLRYLEKFLIATAAGWNAVYADYNRAIPIIARSIDPPLSPPLISRMLDSQRRFLRPFGARFGELDSRRIQVLQEQLLQRRIVQNPIDLTRAINYNVVKEAYRKGANSLNRIEP